MGTHLRQPLARLPRLLKARLSHWHCHLTILVYYAPTDDGHKYIYSFHDLFAGTIRSILPHDQLLVAEHLNVVTGSDRSGFEKVVEPFGNGNKTITLLSSLRCSLLLASRQSVHGFATKTFDAKPGSQTMTERSRDLITSSHAVVRTKGCLQELSVLRIRATGRSLPR